MKKVLVFLLILFLVFSVFIYTVESTDISDETYFSDDYLIVENHDSIDYSSSDFAFGCHFKTNKTGGMLIDKKAKSTEDYKGYTSDINSDGNLHIRLTVSSPIKDFNLFSNNTVDNGEKHSFIVNVDRGENISLYLDGQLADEVPIGSTKDMSNSADLISGKYNPSYLDNIVVYSKILSVQEIYDFNSSIIPSDSRELYLNFEDSDYQGTNKVKNLESGYDATIYNAEWKTALDDNCIYFDGQDGSMSDEGMIFPQFTLSDSVNITSINFDYSTDNRDRKSIPVLAQEFSFYNRTDNLWYNTSSDLDWYGRPVLLNYSGTWISMYRVANSHGGNETEESYFYLRFSDDKGQTWSNKNKYLDGASISGVPFGNNSVGWDVRDGDILEAPNGDILVNIGVVKDGTDKFTIQYSSSDGGLSWSYDGKICGSDEFGGQDHTIYNSTILISTWNNTNNWNSSIYKSTDNGSSWNKISSIGSTSEYQPNELGLTYMGDGKILAVFRDYQSQSDGLTLQSVSNDYGQTWSDTDFIFKDYPYVIQRARLKHYPLKNLTLLFGRWRKTDVLEGAGERNGCLMYSKDEGKTWRGLSIPFGLDTLDSGYSDIIMMDNGTIYLQCYQGFESDEGTAITSCYLNLLGGSESTIYNKNLTIQKMKIDIPEGSSSLTYNLTVANETNPHTSYFEKTIDIINYETLDLSSDDSTDSEDTISDSSVEDSNSISLIDLSVVAIFIVVLFSFVYIMTNGGSDYRR